MGCANNEGSISILDSQANPEQASVFIADAHVFCAMFEFFQKIRVPEEETLA